jgi:hypothetical protein
MILLLVGRTLWELLSGPLHHRRAAPAGDPSSGIGPISSVILDATLSPPIAQVIFKVMASSALHMTAGVERRCAERNGLLLFLTAVTRGC